MVERVEVKEDPAEMADVPTAGRNSAEGLVARDIPGEAMPPAPPEDGEGAPNAWSDEAAESAFRADAHSRGEKVVASAAAIELAEEKETKALPPLADLVRRLSPEIRETLVELFRAKFTAVKRVPRKALKASAG